MKISVVVPCYGAPQSLKQLHAELKSTFSEMGCDYELILVNDACPKNSWAVIKELSQIDKKVIGVNLVKNFGQHNAIACGLQLSTGDWVSVMDCDLQDDPTYLKEMLQEAQKGFDVVLAKREVREERPLKRFQSWAFFKLLRVVTGEQIDHKVGNYGLYSRQVIESINNLKDRVRIFTLMVAWFEYDTTYINIVQKARIEGKSSYTLLKSLKLAFDLAISVTTRPLIWSVQIGALCALISFALGGLFIARYFILGLAPSGWTSLSVGIFFSTGIILLNLGIVGLYVARIYDQTRMRPYFHIKTTLNLSTTPTERKP